MLGTFRLVAKCCRPFHKWCNIASRPNQTLPREVTRSRSYSDAQRVVAEFLQRLDEARQGPIGECLGPALRYSRRQAEPHAGISTCTCPVPRLEGLSAGGGKQVPRFRHSLRLEPGQRRLFSGQRDRHCKATTAHGREQRCSRIATQDVAGLAGGFFQRFQERIRRDGVHALRRMNDHGLAHPARAA
jgi:hypothetical protein